MVNKSMETEKGERNFTGYKPNKSKKTIEESKTKVIDFYNDDEVSRMCPGKKDFVLVKNSEGKLVHLQKRLLLANLHELYLHYIHTHIHTKYLNTEKNHEYNIIKYLQDLKNT